MHTQKHTHLCIYDVNYLPKTVSSLLCRGWRVPIQQRSLQRWGWKNLHWYWCGCSEQTELINVSNKYSKDKVSHKNITVHCTYSKYIIFILWTDMVYTTISDYDNNESPIVLKCTYMLDVSEILINNFSTCSVVCSIPVLVIILSSSIIILRHEDKFFWS